MRPPPSQPLSHGRAQGDATRLVTQQVPRDAHIRVVVRRDQVRQARALQQAHPDARHMGVAGQADDGHAHVERLAGGRRAVIREAVEGDVDGAVRAQVSRQRGHMTEEFDSLQGQPMRLQQRLEARLALRLPEEAVLEQEARLRRLAQQARPERERLVGELVERVERTERRRTPGARGRDADLRREGRGSVAEKASVQAQESLGVE